MTTGELHILNTGHGDITVTFNQHNPDELAKAISMLKDMQRRGYAILVRQDDGTYVRAIEIDEVHGAYIVTGDAAPAVEEPLPLPEEDVAPKRRGRPPGRRKMPIAKSKAVGVARSAGG